VTDPSPPRNPIRASFVCDQHRSHSGTPDAAGGRPHQQQGQPVRVGLAGHQLARALALAFGTSAAQEAPVVQEEGGVSPNRRKFCRPLTSQILMVGATVRSVWKGYRAWAGCHQLSVFQPKYGKSKVPQPDFFGDATIPHTRKRLPEFSAVWAYTPELESSLISERVTAGMRAAESRGRHLGRPGTAHRQRDRGACDLHRPQRPRDPEENCRPGQPWHRRDALARVRRELWTHHDSRTSAAVPDLVRLPRIAINALIGAACYAA